MLELTLELTEGDALTLELIDELTESEALTEELMLELGVEDIEALTEEDAEELTEALTLELGLALVEVLAGAWSRSSRIPKCSTREKPSNFPLIAPEASAKMRIPCPVSQGSGTLNLWK